MSFEIKVLTTSLSESEGDLNAVAQDGWQLISCWQKEKDVVAVFQRLVSEVKSNKPIAPSPNKRTPQEAPTPVTESAPTAIPLPAKVFTLDAVLTACLAGKLNKWGYGLKVSDLAKQQKIDAAEMLTHLHELGLKNRDKSEHSLLSHGDYNLSLFAGKSNSWYVNAALKPQ